MKKNLILVLGLCAITAFTSCKSRESAYRQAWEQAMAQDKTQSNEQQVTDNADQQEVTTPISSTVTETVVTPVTTPSSSSSDQSDARPINGNVSLVSGLPLKNYSVVVGSFVTQANAEAARANLQKEGYDARIIKTDETIKGVTPWYRVIAASYDDIASARQSRDTLRQKFVGAWLYRK